jgi:cystathionine beta-lyase/cystathionine gamma-synthase
MGGSVAGKADVAKAMRDRTILDGGYMPPHEAWLCIRGMRTLEVRMQRHWANAMRVATFLAAHPKVSLVRYPGLPSHPQHELAKRQFGGRFGGIVTFDLKAGTQAAAFRFLDALQLAASATTLGDLWSEVLYPAISSHRRVAPEERKRLGISDGTLRLSVGIEDADDLIGDVENALARV